MTTEEATLATQGDSDASLEGRVEQVESELQAAFERANKPEFAEDVRWLDLSSDRYIIFSDLHKGARNRADDFRRTERAYNAALAYYFEMGYTLVVLGDARDVGRRACLYLESLRAYV